SSSCCRRRARRASARSCWRRPSGRSPRAAACACSCSWESTTRPRVPSTRGAATRRAQATRCSTSRSADVTNRNMPALITGTRLAGALALLCALLAAPAHADIYSEAVAHAGRPAEDLKRDAIDHPAEVLRLARIGRGMRVADFLAGDGYYSQLLSYIVGPKGHVYLLNNDPYDRWT